MNPKTLRIPSSSVCRVATPLGLVITLAVFAGCQSTPEQTLILLGCRRGHRTPCPDRFHRRWDPTAALSTNLTRREPAHVGRCPTTGRHHRSRTAGGDGRVRIALADADQSRLLPNPVLNVVPRWGPGKPQIEASLARRTLCKRCRFLDVPAADNRLRQAAADAVTVAIDVASEVQERYATAQASAEVVPLLRDRMVLLERLAAVASPGSMRARDARPRHPPISAGSNCRWRSTRRCFLSGRNAFGWHASSASLLRPRIVVARRMDRAGQRPPARISLG